MTYATPMALSDRLRTKALEAAEKAKAVAAENAARAATSAREAIEARSGTAGPRLIALLRMDDDEPITVEGLVLVLVDAVHSDDEASELSDRDVYKAAKRRYRRLGTVALPSGPIGGYVVNLYCEAATLCDIVELRAVPLSQEEIAAHLLVLWGAMPDTTSATAAIDGSGPSVLTTFALRAKDRMGLPASGPPTKRQVIATLWRSRDAVSSVRDVDAPGVRESLFPGGRVKEFIAAAHGQLDAHAPSQ